MSRAVIGGRSLVPGRAGAVRSLGRRSVRGYRAVTGSAPGRLLVDGQVRRVAMSRPRPLREAERRWVSQIEGARASLNVRSDPVPERKRPPHTVGGVARRASLPQNTGELLLKLVRGFRPAVGVELGTCVGVSACYQAAAMELNGQGRLITLEANPTLCEVARETVSGLGLADRVEVRRGRFDDILPEVLGEHPDYVFIDGNHTEKATLRYFEAFEDAAPGRGLLVFDDIEWSEGMREAWARIRVDPRVRWSTAVSRTGLCVLRGS